MRIRSLLVSLSILTLLFTVAVAPIQAQSDGIEFPALSGSHQVGRTTYDMIDESREESFTADENDVRAFTITVFYPAIPDENAEPASYVDEALLPAMEEYTGIPIAIWEGFEPHAYADAPMVDGEFPVILFSHGSGTPLVAYTGLMEDLASQGYVVVGISHTFDTPVVALSDGRILTLGDVDSFEAFVEDEDQALLSIYLADMLFALDQLVELNSGDGLLANHLDLRRIGAMGHSFGGSTALQAAYEDERILAVLNLDGTIYGEVREHGLNRPTLIMAQDVSILGDGFEIVDEYTDEEGTVVSTVDPEELIADYVRSRDEMLSKTSPGYDLVLRGASHDTYATDVLVLAEAIPDFAVPDFVGTIEDLSGTRTTIHTTVLAFFNTYVGGSNSPQMDDLSFDGFDVTIYNEE